MKGNPMRTTLEFLDAIKARHGGLSDYALAKLLGVHQTTTSKYRTGRDFLGPETAETVAKLLDIDPAYILVCAHAERAKRESEKAIWQRIARRIERDNYRGLCIMSTQPGGSFLQLLARFRRRADCRGTIQRQLPLPFFIPAPVFQ